MHIQHLKNGNKQKKIVYTTTAFLNIYAHIAISTKQLYNIFCMFIVA